mmetsp:Transcript_70136/g.158577  ORF Transcript_70136/g.158577 Transcript_70136/m.158577 type:complete len:231 (-) Transcript_70136:87-779(-)
MLRGGLEVLGASPALGAASSLFGDPGGGPAASGGGLAAPVVQFGGFLSGPPGEALGSGGEDGGGVNSAAGDKAGEEARRRTQRAHELLRHLFALRSKATSAARAEEARRASSKSDPAAPPEKWGEAEPRAGGVSGGGAGLLGHMSSAERAKLGRLEGCMEALLAEVRALTRRCLERAGDETTGQPGAASATGAAALLRRVEQQLVRGFSVIDELRGNASSAGGFAAVTSP